MPRSITLLGSSSGRNAGDAALVSGIMDSIDEVCGSRLLYEIPTIRPEFVWQNYENRVRPISMLPWSLSVKMFGVPTYQSIMRTDLSLIFDAILFDRSLYNPLFNHMSTLRALLPVAKRRGKKLGCFNVGVGPVDTPAGRQMLVEISELMDFITVRDQDSFDLLRDIGVKNPRLITTADAAIGVKPARAERVDEILELLGFQPGEQILGINVNTYIDSWSATKRNALTRDKFCEIYANALNRVLKEVDLPILFVATQYHDVGITRQIMGRLSSLRRVALISNMQYSHYEIKGVLSRVSLLFAMRLHAMILASSELTPCIAIAYQPKIEHYLSSMGMKDLALTFENFSEESVYQHIMMGWNRRAEIRSILAEKIPVLRQKARVAAEIVQALDNGDDAIDKFFA